MLKAKLLLGALVALLPSYCYSEGIKPYYGVTDNAAGNALTWSMPSILPAATGLEIQGVIYSYNIVKNSQDATSVHIQNSSADGLGYIFRSSDYWAVGSLSGTGINRVVPLAESISRSAWGDGSIEVSGPGSVDNAVVRYQYRVDPCFDPQSSPACPNYVAPAPSIYDVTYEIYDASMHSRNDQYSSIYNSEEGESSEEAEKREAEEARDSRERLEKALAASDTSALFAQALAASAALASVGTNVTSYYEKNIAGGIYVESIAMQDSKLPDSTSGLRNNLAQQQLHTRMIEMQYN